MEYDAFLLISFGGPEGPDDVMPFLRNVTRGRAVSEERLLEVADHYHRFGGVSPINGLNRELIAALEIGFAERGLALPIYWGNRNWQPLLADTLRQMRDDGVKRAIALATSAYSSYSGCRQYIEDIQRATDEVGRDAPIVDKLPPFWAEPGFMMANEDRLVDVISENAIYVSRDDVAVIYTAHSIPEVMAANCDYETQLMYIAKTLSDTLGVKHFEMAYQSRSGPPTQKWLEPDIADAIRAATARGARTILVHPIGFVADHMEVVYDLDVEAKAVCEELGVRFFRVPTVGTHPAFVDMICDLVEGVSLVSLSPGLCDPSCCASGRVVSLGQRHNE